MNIDFIKRTAVKSFDLLIHRIMQIFMNDIDTFCKSHTAAF